MDRFISVRTLAALTTFVFTLCLLFVEAQAGLRGPGGAGRIQKLTSPPPGGEAAWWGSASLPQDQVGGGGPEKETRGTPLAILDGDSALAELTRAANRSSDRDLAGRASMRAGFLLYIKGDFTRAEALFAAAEDKGIADAALWRGLALLADDRISDAEKVLRGAQRSARDSVAAVAASVGLAACDLAAGRPGEGAERCRGMMEKDGGGVAAASILMQRCLFELGEGDQSVAALERLAQKYPLAYEVAVVKNTKAPVRTDTPAETGQPEGTSEVEERQQEQAGESEASEAATSAGESAEGEDSDDGWPDDSGVGETAGDSESSSAEPGFTVQVGAFSDVHNAESLVRSLADKGYNSARIESENREGHVYHCVRVGVFVSRDEAVSLAAILEEREDLNTAIVRTRVPVSSSGADEE